MFRLITKRVTTNSTFIRRYSTRVDDKLKGLVLGIYETELSDEPKLTKSAKKLNDQYNGRLYEMIKESGMTGRLSETRVFTNLHPDYHVICVTGLGKECDEYNPHESIFQGMENVRQAGKLLHVLTARSRFYDPNDVDINMLAIISTIVTTFMGTKFLC